MPHDPALLAETRAWLVKSNQGLKAAELLLHADPALKPIAAHHAQQAAEKSLKAFLESSPDEAKEALRLAGELFDAILARLPSEVRP